MPAELVAEIQTAGNDIQQETYFVRKELGASPWPAYDAEAEQSEFMLHFASNQPVGVPWGEPDLAPLLPWIGRLSSMLEDRARLHRFRNAFLFVVNGRFGNAAEKEARRREIAADPPQPGSVLVTDENETWSVISPELNSSDARRGHPGHQEIRGLGRELSAALAGGAGEQHAHDRRGRRHAHLPQPGGDPDAISSPCCPGWRAWRCRCASGMTGG